MKTRQHQDAYPSWEQVAYSRMHIALEICRVSSPKTIDPSAFASEFVVAASRHGCDRGGKPYRQHACEYGHVNDSSRHDHAHSLSPNDYRNEPNRVEGGSLPFVRHFEMKKVNWRGRTFALSSKYFSFFKNYISLIANIFYFLKKTSDGGNRH